MVLRLMVMMTDGEGNLCGRKGQITRHGLGEIKCHTMKYGRIAKEAYC